MSTIDRDMLIKKYINPDIEKFHNSDVKIVLENLKQNILKMPTIDSLQGEWIETLDGNEWYWCCSNCKEQWYEEDLWMGGNEFPHFCPHCGARMKGVDDV